MEIPTNRVFRLRYREFAARCFREGFSRASISLNTRGLKNNVKREASFLSCKEQKANCVFLQETHSAEADSKLWKLQLGGETLFSLVMEHRIQLAQ